MSDGRRGGGGGERNSRSRRSRRRKEGVTVVIAGGGSTCQIPPGRDTAYTTTVSGTIGNCVTACVVVKKEVERDRVG